MLCLDVVQIRTEQDGNQESKKYTNYYKEVPWCSQYSAKNTSIFIFGCLDSITKIANVFWKEGKGPRRRSTVRD